MRLTQHVVVAGERHRVRRAGFLERLLQPFWVLPALVTLAAFVLGLGLPVFDERLSHRVPLAFPGGPDGARGLLSTIASAMISVTGLVFSITMVVLQLASSQFTPRVLRHFLSNRVTQWTLGVFIASFVYSLTVLREVRGGFDGDAPFVPQLSVSVAYVLVLAPVALFVAFIRQITSMIQVSQVISRLGDTTCDALQRLLPEPGCPPTTAPWEPAGTMSRHTVRDRHGHVTEVDEHALLALAESHDLHIELALQPGDFVAPGDPLARVYGEGPDDLPERIDRAVSLASHRSIERDPLFGVRQLVDIADRALSPGVNDPTTAVEVLHELRRVLGVAARRADAPWFVADEHGAARLRRPQFRFRDLLSLATEEIHHYSREGVQVPREIEWMLASLESIATAENQTALREARQSLARAGGGAS